MLHNGRMMNELTFTLFRLLVSVRALGSGLRTTRPEIVTDVTVLPFRVKVSFASAEMNLDRSAYGAYDKRVQLQL